MKWALILGSSGDIGGQIARDLAQQGWSLYLHYAHRQDRIEKLISEFQSKYSRQDFIPIQSDFMAADCADQIANSIFGVDAVVFAQGTTHFKFLHDFTENELDEILRMQLKVPMHHMLSKTDDDAERFEIKKNRLFLSVRCTVKAAVQWKRRTARLKGQSIHLLKRTAKKWLRWESRSTQLLREQLIPR